jgi:hypothetical protein
MVFFFFKNMSLWSRNIIKHASFRNEINFFPLIAYLFFIQNVYFFRYSRFVCLFIIKKCIYFAVTVNPYAQYAYFVVENVYFCRDSTLVCLFFVKNGYILPWQFAQYAYFFVENVYFCRASTFVCLFFVKKMCMFCRDSTPIAQFACFFVESADGSQMPIFCKKMYIFCRDSPPVCICLWEIFLTLTHQSLLSSLHAESIQGDLIGPIFATGCAFS